MKTIIIIMALAGCASAQSAAPQAPLPAKPVVSTAPSITTEQRARFWRAQTELMDGTMRVEKARANLNAAEAEMVKACGSAYDLTLTADGEPGCVLKAPSPSENTAVEVKK